jgi:hypothetical protein
VELIIMRRFLPTFVPKYPENPTNAINSYKNNVKIFACSRGHPDLNRGPPDLQSDALPLSYTPAMPPNYTRNNIADNAELQKMMRHVESIFFSVSKRLVEGQQKKTDVECANKGDEYIATNEIDAR